MRLPLTGTLLTSLAASSLAAALPAEAGGASGISTASEKPEASATAIQHWTSPNVPPLANIPKAPSLPNIPSIPNLVPKLTEALAGPLSQFVSLATLLPALADPTKCTDQEVDCAFLRSTSNNLQNEEDDCLRIATGFDFNGKPNVDPLAQDARNVVYGVTTDGLPSSAWCTDIGWALRRIFNSCRKGKSCYGGSASAARNSAFLVAVGPKLGAEKIPKPTPGPRIPGIPNLPNLPNVPGIPNLPNLPGPLHGDHGPKGKAGPPGPPTHGGPQGNPNHGGPGGKNGHPKR